MTDEHKPDPLLDTGQFRVLMEKYNKEKALLARQVPEVAPPTKVPFSPYLISIIFVVLAGLLCFGVILNIHPETEPVVLGSVVLGFVTLTVNVLINTMMTQDTRREAQEAKQEAKAAAITSIKTGLQVDGRLDAFIENATAAANAEGQKQGRQDADDRTDMLAGNK